MNTTARRLAALAVVGAVVLGGLSVAQAANATSITGNITLYAPAVNNGLTRGPAITSGSLTTSPMFNGISVDQGCPAGFRGRSDTFVFQGGVKLSSIASSRNSSTTAYGATGLDGNPIAMDDTFSQPGTNPFVNNTALGNVPGLVSGAFEIRVYCSALSTSIDYTNDKWFSVTLNANTTAGTWNVPVPKTATTTSLTAAASGTSIALTGTVKDPSSATATAAVGSINFFDSTGTTLVGTGTVSSGVGTFTVTGLAPGTYTYTAKFIGNNDPTYADSPLSAGSTASIAGSNSGASNVTVTIPAGVGTLTLSGVATSVSLGTATYSGGLLTATGTLPAVTVTDTRQATSPGWSLTGQVSDFTAGSNVLSGAYLGWVPALSGTTNEGTAGATVAPSTTTTGGLKTASTLATAPVVTNSSPTSTTVGATLNLAAPAKTAPGAYSAVLTLTLA